VNTSHIYDVYLSGGYGLAVSTPENPEYQLLVLAYHLGVGAVIPFVIIVGCNVGIITTIRSAAEKRGEMGQDEKGKKTTERETRYLTRMLVIVCLAYAMLSLPYRLYDFFLMIPAIGDQYKTDTSRYWQFRHLFEAWLLSHIWDWNYGVNFYLYCIGGGKRYRSQVTNMLPCKRSNK
jgi:hypothetical protein